MKTDVFVANLEEAKSRLADVGVGRAACRAKGTLGRESYSFFDSFSIFQRQLSDVIDMVELRELCFDAALKFPQQGSPSGNGKFMFSGVEVSFKQGRYLTINAYASLSWTIYDALTKIAGILCCVDGKAKSQFAAPKLPDDFVNGTASVGARVRDHIKGAYGWPIGISYALRNWFVHDGFSYEADQLFKYDEVGVGDFEIADEAWAQILQRCAEKYKANDKETRLAQFPNLKIDILNGLHQCHEEVDEAVDFLMQWAVSGVFRQAELLFKRDTV